MVMAEMFAELGSLAAGAMFLWAMFRQYFPYQLRPYIEKYSHNLVSFVYPYIQITVQEFTENSFRRKRSEAYAAIENYLILSMDDHEEVTDEFKGVKLWWASNKNPPPMQTISFYPAADGKRYYKLTFHKQYRDLIVGSYLNHVIKEGKAIAVRNRQRKLYTNNPSQNWYGYKKSVMIAAMANLLNYDIYDLELTSVKDNTELRKLLIETTSKSILVIEDIDCSLDLTGQRKKKKEKEEEDEDKESKVTLSGLLNFIDGLWSACGEERLIVFTTNHVEKLDPALIRRGRMDKHIELSYCCFEAFKVLAKNYLDLDSHHLFASIRRLLEETNMTPADVAENLMPKSITLKLLLTSYNIFKSTYNSIKILRLFLRKLL
ncbi:unnamed protein product, partial [Vitis vinifera]